MLVSSFVKISPLVSELLRNMIFILKFTKEHNSVKTVDGVTVIILCILSADAIYLSQVL